MRKVLFISNGHGEDMVGAHIAAALEGTSEDIKISAFPVVGKGKFYLNYGFPVVAPTRILPSGGFLHQSLGYFLKDLNSGLLTLTLRQLMALRTLRHRGDIALAVGVGDGIPLILNSLALQAPMAFIGIAKSSRYRDGRNPYTSLECRILHTYCRKVIVRDPETQIALKSVGIPALYMGNPMMDCMARPEHIPEFLKSCYVVGVLPGSREEAYDHIEFLLPVAQELAGRIGSAVTFAFALADTLDIERVTAIADKAFGTGAVHLGDTATPDAVRLSDTALGHGLPADSIGKSMPSSGLQPAPEQKLPVGRGPAILYPLGNDSNLIMAKGLFGEILTASTVVIGLSGTANEQAAGMGKPIVTFPGRGPQITERFVRDQKKLLGDALTITSRDPRAICNEVESLLRDSVRREKMGQEGRQRMEGHGSCKRIALSILDALDENR